MIVLDTNALKGEGTGRSTKAVMLVGLARECGHPLALPQRALEERLALYGREVQTALAKDDRDEVLKLVPDWLARPEVARGQEAALPKVQGAVNDLEAVLRRHYAVLPTPEGAVDEAHRREVHRIRPASSSGGEGRDVVIWLTVLEKARSWQPSRFFFVSNDNGFKESGTQRLHHDLRREAPSNLHYFSSTAGVRDVLSRPAEADESVAASEEVLHAVQQTALFGLHDENHPLRKALWGWKPDGASGMSAGTADVALLELYGHEARSVGPAQLTALSASYRLDLTWNGQPPVAVKVGLGILVKHVDGVLAWVRVEANGGVRPA